MHLDKYLTPKERGIVRKKHILQLVIKNTSELDYTLPIIQELSRSDDFHITVFYCSFNKINFIKNGLFFNEILEESKISQKDFSDLIHFEFIKKILRNIFSDSYSNRVELKTSMKIAFKKLTEQKMNKKSLFEIFYSIYYKFIEVIEKQIFIFFKVENLLENIHPDILLIGHRSRPIKWKKNFLRICEEKKIPVVLLPHAPHQIHPTEDFIPYDVNYKSINGKAFIPNNCDYWMSFIYDRLWENTDNQKKNFPYIGYPAFDTSWNQYLQERKCKKLEKEKKCLVILRRFTPKGVRRPDGLDPFIIDYSEMERFLKAIKYSIDKQNKKIFVIIKPHPSNKIGEVQEIFSELNFDNFEISSEPFFPLFSRIDFVVSLFSTSLLLPIMHHIPTILMHSNLQDYVHKKWDNLETMYENLSYYIKNNHEMCIAVSEITDDNFHYQHNDYDHIREFFPDNSIQKSIERMMFLMKKRSFFHTEM